MQTVKVTIKADGQAVIKVEGNPGPGCTKLTKELQEALGSTTKDDKTSEYYQQPATNKQQLKAKG
jgi:hypothetical protein